MAGAAQWVQFFVFAIATIGVAVALARGSGHGRRLAPCWACLVILVLAAGVFWTQQSERRARSYTTLVSDTPQTNLRDDGYVGSATCQSCHPHHHATWHHSFHRTMTQTATPRAVLGNFNNVPLKALGRDYHLERRGDEFWINMVDPDWESDLLAQGVYPNQAPDPPRGDKRVVMTTGSHHMQTYWVKSSRDERLFNVAWVWLNDDQRWVPREDVFLRAREYGRMFSTWHDNCIECHSTAGMPEHDPELARQRQVVAELGIACEACHGPAAEHIRVNRDPKHRYRLRMTGAPDPTIINPARLPAAESSMVCGQCHSINVFKSQEVAEGARYRPGGDLFESRMTLRLSDEKMSPREREHWPRLQRHLARQSETFISDRMWPDGMVRVSGREYTAMVESECFAGDLSCLSCHSMHDPVSNDDQFQAGMETNQACTQCHASAEYDSEAHTHHLSGSSGALCYNCHMPHTTYGLMKAIRSHLIDSPTVASTLETGRPNACNLCHLDRSLAWTADHLQEWYGQDPVTLDEDQREVSAAVLSSLSGDANQRALIAWHMGWEPAGETSGKRWMAPYLGHLLADPYSAVRYIALRSLRRLPGFSNFEYDFLAEGRPRAEARRRAISLGQRLLRDAKQEWRAAVLLDEQGILVVQKLDELARQRDERVIDLRE